MLTNFNSQIDVSWEEADTLISILRAWGVEYLVGLEHTPNPCNTSAEQISPVTLIQHLAQCNEYPRIRDASISLFLLHPELVNDILEAIKTNEPEVAEQITTLTLATLYLQQLWSIRLALAFGHLPNFPEQPFAHLWQSRYLPSPSCYNGKWGLVALQAFEQRRTGLPFTFIGDWQNQIDHLLLQEETHHRTFTVSTDQLLENEQENCQEFEMSMRPNVDKKAIDSFLQQLGRTFRKPGRLYLVGGAALIHAGVRPGFTEDIDVEVRAADENEMLEIIRQLKDTMKINVEFAAPGDFIPIPNQWEMNSRYVGRYGTIDVFYFDFYSIALSKIERGNTRDINDVRLLVQQGIISLQELDAAYNEVLPQVGKRPYNRLDPQKFAERYAAVRQLL